MLNTKHLSGGKTKIKWLSVCSEVPNDAKKSSLGLNCSRRQYRAVDIEWMNDDLWAPNQDHRESHLLGWSEIKTFHWSVTAWLLHGHSGSIFLGFSKETDMNLWQMFPPDGQNVICGHFYHTFPFVTMVIGQMKLHTQTSCDLKQSNGKYSPWGTSWIHLSGHWAP